MLSLTVEQRSWMHRLPVWLKLLLLCLFTLVLWPLEDWRLLLASCLPVAVLYFSAGRSFAKLGAQRLKPVVYLVAIIFIYQIVTGRIEEGLAICLKIIATVSLANLVTMTSRLDDMMAVIETLAKPFYALGLPPRALGFAMGLVIRFTPLFLQRGIQLNHAWRARSPRRTSPRLLVPLALSAIDDADRVAEALKARGGLQNIKAKEIQSDSASQTRADKM
ncbi:energy-coupling factor transporter transmembrane component T [uncultured Cohaesibacter sp.]|uniref:energy-coupling factor transporter transmembrane component T family protein n=1 Tax=uncultured Cohaesibacter sp. TaxID=1002546 RepID=UPI002AA960AB|nr:energy-coupling factor transporter transmembrane component T [uncultured Cohaesibacter sp.]